MKNAKLDSIMLLAISNTTSIKLGEAGIVKIDTAQWTQDELAAINHIIEFLSSLFKNLCEYNKCYIFNMYYVIFICRNWYKADFVYR